MQNYTLCSLSFKTTSDYEQNLQTLLSLIKQTSDNTIIVAPEVCLTGFDYPHFDEVIHFSHRAIQEIKKVSHNKIIILTIIEKKSHSTYNSLKVFHNNEIVYERPKIKLFRFGNEHKYFQEGNIESFQTIEIDNIKIGILICFELRFKNLWILNEGVDIIAIPAYWGALRKQHFISLTQALSIINQCYVIASDSLNNECSKVNAIYTPQGITHIKNNSNLPLQIPYKPKEVTLMRRYMDVGIR